MRSDQVVLLPPLLDHDPCRLQRVEDLPIQAFLPQLPIEALAVPVLPRTARLDIQGTGSQALEPVPQLPDRNSNYRKEVTRLTSRAGVCEPGAELKPQQSEQPKDEVAVGGRVRHDLLDFEARFVLEQAIENVERVADRPGDDDGA